MAGSYQFAKGADGTGTHPDATEGTYRATFAGEATCPTGAVTFTGTFDE